MLCEECRLFFNQQWTQEFTNKGNYLEVGRFHSEASESGRLVKVKQSSCELCIFIAACPTTTASTSPFLETRLPKGGPQYSVCLLFSMVEHSLSIFNSKDTGEETFVSLNLSRNSDILNLSAHHQMVLTTNTRPESCLPRIKNWMDQCAVNHELCRRLRHQRCENDISWYPTRLVDVSPETTSSSVRLEDDPRKLAGAQYSTLSYCWGPDPQFLKLKCSNYGDFKNGFPTSNLPKTLQDAVVLTRKLGLRFIWIDALCIIQDSAGHEDWLQESLKMSQIYGRSYINIAASSADTAEGGLFRERDPVATSGIVVKPHGNEKEGYVITQQKHWLPQLQFEPLNLRAWAFQERRMSWRTLHFTDSQVFWECNDLCASETYPSGKPWDKQWSHRQKKISMARDANITTLTERYDAWWWLVCEYSRGGLTVNTDRLIAMAGLARSFNVVADDTYIGGHWSSDVPHSLLWHVNQPVKKSGGTYLAPTWSWASMPPGIILDRPPPQRFLSRVDIMELKVENTGDQFGPINRGVLRLCGRMCMTQFSLNLRKDNRFASTKYNLKFHTYNAGYETKSLIIAIDEVAEYDGKEVFCIELELGGLLFEPDQHKLMGRKWTGVIPRLRGLLLCPTYEKRGEFKRIGCYFERTINFPLVKSKLRYILHNWQDYANMDAAFHRRNVPCQYFENLDSMRRYTISIV